MKEDIKILNQKIDEGIKQCVADSDKMAKTMQHKTRAEINDETDIMNQKLGEITRRYGHRIRDSQN